MEEKELSEEIYIAFDATHKNRGKINDNNNYSDLRDFLNQNKFVCYNYLDPINYENLRPYDIFVLACPDFAKLNRQEISFIERWVLEDGGGLLLLSHAGGDKGRNSNLSELSERFGIAFENDQVLDETNNLGFENLPIVEDFRPPHPTTEGITSYCHRAGCSLTIIGNAFSIAYSNDTSEPFTCPLICVSQPEKGKVCAIGSYEIFRNDIGGGFDHELHSKLALNIFRWLVSENRMEMKSKGLRSAPEISGNVYEVNSFRSAEQAEMIPSISEEEIASATQKPDIDFDIKISNKSELIELLKIFSKQINKIQKTIEKLLKVASASESEIVELQKTRVCVPPSEVDALEIQKDSIEIGAKQEEGSMNKEDIIQSIVSDLSKKSSLKEKDVLLDMKKKGEEKKSDDTKESLKKKEDEEKEKEKINKVDLMKEKENLQNRIQSLNYLQEFSEKKLESGKWDNKSYESQSKLLKEEVKLLNKKIREIDAILEKH